VGFCTTTEEGVLFGISFYFRGIPRNFREFRVRNSGEFRIIIRNSKKIMHGIPEEFTGAGTTLFRIRI
jgi:hypothetical protein